jgi:hypothetical protein
LAIDDHYLAAAGVLLLLQLQTAAGCGGSSSSPSCWIGALLLWLIVITLASVLRTPLVAHFDNFDTALKRPVAEKTRKDEAKRSEAAPTCQPVVNRSTRARGVGTRFATSTTLCSFYFVFIFALIVVATSSLTVA